MAINHGDNARNVMCNAVVDLIDNGANAGELRIIDGTKGTPYVSGNAGLDLTDNATVENTAGTWTDYIAKLTFDATAAFKDAGLPNDDGSIGGRNGTAHANPVAQDEDCHEGTASHFEIVDGDGVLIMNGIITHQNETPPGDILLTSVGIANEDTIAIRNLSYTCAP
jgi:hypothetical protein